MKKIGILTSTPSFVSNYGAILQAYALQTQLKKIGCLPQIIKYADDNEYIKGRMPLKQRIMSSIFSKNLSLYAKRKLIINKILNRSVIPKFKEFQINNIDFYNKEYIDYEELKMIANEFYAFIVGSDQVWNPIVHHGVNDPGYFLQFVPSGIKRIAYAPSMGVNKLPKECLDTLHDFLVSFDSISIREETGRKIILDNCGIDVQVVVDPTLLLSQKDYNNIRNVSICPQIPYLVYYKFGRISEIDYIVKKIAKINNYKIVCIPAGLETKFTADYNIGPREFIGLISNVTLRGGSKTKSRVQQLADWFGKDYDGVIAFDEAHNMGNLLGKAGKFGKAKGSAKAIAAASLSLSTSSFLRSSSSRICRRIYVKSASRSSRPLDRPESRLPPVSGLTRVLYSSPAS